jgi:hypothetical protein
VAAGRADVLLVSLGSTGGLRAADDELMASLRRAGASVAMVRSARPQPVRTLALTDLSWALSAREAALGGIELARPRAVIYSTTTAALLAPAPGAIRFDAPSAGNRPGRHGVWQRPLERRRLRLATLLVPWSEGGLAEVAPPHADALVVPVPVTASGPPPPIRDIAAITYGANPHKKGLDRVLDAWRGARRPGEQLIVAGIHAADAARAVGRRLAAASAVTFAGALEAGDYRALLRRSRVFVTGVRREDYGIAQLEALADGCQLVTTAPDGPYAALPVARRLDARLVGDDLAAALRTALDSPRPDYAAAAIAELAAWEPTAVDALVAERLLPCLLAGESPRLA